MPLLSRALPARRVRHGRVHRVGRARSAVRARPGLRSLFGSLRAGADASPATSWSPRRSSGSRAAGKAFAWVHLYDPHAPYVPPGRYAAEYAGRPYDGTVAWSDELVGRLVSALRDAGTSRRHARVVTSDHGEALGEHGEDVHGYFVYEATLRVPLVIRGPGVKPGTRIAGVARTVDLFPTIVEMAGLAAANRPWPARARARPARRLDRPTGLLRGVARAPSALRMERPARRARRPVEIHPRAEARALRSRQGSRRAEEPGGRGAGAGERDAREPRGATPRREVGLGRRSLGGEGGANRAPRPQVCRPRCSSGLARSATSARADRRTRSRPEPIRRTSSPTTRR